MSPAPGYDPFTRGLIPSSEVPVENAIPETDFEEFVVFKIDANNGKLQLSEVAQVLAFDADRALILVAEDMPQLADKKLCALRPSTVRGQTVRMRYIASLTDD